jgi:hypothetical protein
MNAPANGTQRTTPQKRTVRDIFLDKLKSAKKYYDLAMEISGEFTTPENVLRFGSERAAYIACAQDVRWQEAVENEKFNERLANMYGQAAVLQELESQHNTLNAIHSLIHRQIAEQKKTNEFLAKIAQSAHE